MALSLTPFILDCKTLLAQEWTIGLHHVLCEANGVANNLAGRALALGGVKPPKWLFYILYAPKHATSRVVYLKKIQPSYDKLLNLQPTVHLDVSIKDIILFTHLSLSLSLFGLLVRHYFIIFYGVAILFYCVVWKNKNRKVECTVKWEGIIDKVTF